MRNQEVAVMSDRIEKQTELNAPIAKVWRALTDYRQFGQWFKVNIEAPFVPGKVSRGQFTNAGFEHVIWHATIERMDEPSRFSFRWHPFAIEPGVDYSAEEMTLIEFTLEPTDTGTRLTVVESGFDALPAHRRDEAFRMNDGGWAAQLRNIKAYVES
jgi:uncharacterized protein YndB with AHSA1/START domain